MQSITLQTGDTIITSGDQLGQLQFAASAESDGGAALLVVGRISCQAEGSFGSSSNPSSLILSTSAADANAVVDRIKITDNGHVLPASDNSYDLGNTNLGFRNGYFSEGVILASNAPSVTTNKLYNEGGTLKFNGSPVAGGGGTMTTVKANGSQVGGADIATLDFSSNFTVTESPDTEANIELASSISTDTLTLTKAYKSSVEANTDGATITFNLDESNLHTVTLGGSRTLAISNEDVGQRFILRLTQDGTGSRVATWFSTIKWPGDLTPSLTATAGKTDVFGFICTSAGNYDGFVIGYNL